MAYYNQHNTWNFWHTYRLEAFLRQAQHYDWLPPTSPWPATKKLKDVLEESIMTTLAIWMPLALAWPGSSGIFLQLFCVSLFWIDFAHGAQNATEFRLCGKAMTLRGKTAFSCGNTLILRFGLPKNKKKDFYRFLDFLCLEWRANLVWAFLSALPTQFFAIHFKSALSCAATHDCATIHTCVGWPHGSFSKRGSNNYTCTVIIGWACVQPFQGCPINCMSKSMISHLDSGSHRVNYVNLPVLLRLTFLYYSLNADEGVYEHDLKVSLTTRSWEAEHPHWNRWVFPKNSGFSPQIINFYRVFHYFHHPFWGIPIFGSTPRLKSWVLASTKLFPNLLCEHLDHSNKTRCWG